MRMEKRENEVVSCACRQLASGNKNLVHVTALSRSCRHMRHGKCGFIINGTGNNTTQLPPCNFLPAPSPLELPYKKGMQIKNRNAINWSGCKKGVRSMQSISLLVPNM
jgi:hypothetical protein